ncbi:MAG TPA: ATP-binding protein [Kofleriaceae bacterium]
MRLPPDGRLPVVAYDGVLVALGLVLFTVCRRLQLSSAGFHALGATLALAILGNIALVTILDPSRPFTYYVAVLLVGSAGTMLSWRWSLVTAGVEVAGWAITAPFVIPRDRLAENTMMIATILVVAFVVQVARARARARIFDLRGEDARRELALQRALAEADEARRELDRKVEERTCALRNELTERERLEAQLRHAQKMEAVGRLAGGIAHDFNNLLTVIRLSLMTLDEPGTAPAELADALRDASDATDRAAALTHDLLAFARKQTLERTSVAAGDLLGGVERMVRRVAEAGVKLEVAIAADAGEIIADRHQIEQVLLNLAINACDAMSNRGTLTLTAEATELTGATAEQHRLRPGHYVRFAVRDTGTGMDEATKRAAFEPFFTTKEVGRGTGLGLAVAHGIVTQHAGQIEIDSAPGAGSTFTVYLPRARGGSHSGVIPMVKPPLSAAHETVLVVEDEPAVRRAVQRNLERLGYRVISAEDGEDALRIAEGLDGIDLLLSDVVMPNLDGPELAIRLRARWHDLPVLFVTGYSADRLAPTGAVGPHDRVLEKPYQLEELARTIRGMLAARARRATA